MHGSGSAPHCPCSGADNPNTGLVTWTSPVLCISTSADALPEKCHEVRNRPVTMTMAKHRATRDPLWIAVRRRSGQSAVTKLRLERRHCMHVGGEVTIELAINSIGAVVLGCCSAQGLDSRSNAHTALDCVASVVEVASADAGEEGCTIGRAFFGSECRYRSTVDIGLELAPKRTLAAAASCADVGGRDTQFVHDTEPIAERIGDALEHRTGHVTDRVATG